MRLLFLGDSITYGCNAFDLESGFVSIVQSKTGFECLNFGVIGTRIAPTQGKVIYPEFEEDFLKRAKRMPDADYVFVFGGTNDFGHGDAPLGNINDKSQKTFAGSLFTLYTYLLDKYGKEKIVIIPPLHRWDENSTRGENFNAKKEGSPVLNDYVKVIKQIANNFGFRVLDISNNIGFVDENNKNSNPFICSDGLHPKQTGHNLIASLIIEFLKDNKIVKFNNDSKIKDIFNDKFFNPYSKYLFYNWDINIEKTNIYLIGSTTLDSINKFYNLVKDGKTSICHFDNRENANLIHLKHNDNRKVAIVLSGGSFKFIANSKEALPIAERLYDLGYDAFILNYSVGESNLLSKLNDDLVNSIRFLLENEKKLKINMKNYAVIGSSAGGFIAAQLGSNNHGYIKYNLPKPGLICLQYPIVYISKKMKEKECLDAISTGIVLSKELENEYSTNLHVDKNYPKTFIVRAKVDKAVDKSHCDLLVQALSKNNVDYIFDILPGSGHGWGLGNETEFNGWLENAVNFWEH